MVILATRQRRPFPSSMDSDDSSQAVTGDLSRSPKARSTVGLDQSKHSQISASARRRCNWRAITGSFTSKFIQDKTTVLFTTTSLLIISACFTLRALFTPRSSGCTSIPAFDDNFFSNLSQLFTNLCSLYLIIVPLLRHRSLCVGYKFWYRFCLTLSLLTAGATPVVYPYSWKVSLVLGLVSGLLQVIGSVQLVECFQDAVDAGDIGFVELRLLGGE